MSVTKTCYPSCGETVENKWPTPGRVVQMTWGQYQAACFPEGLLVRVTDIGKKPRLYIGLGGVPCWIVTADDMCELIEDAIEYAQAGATNGAE